MSIVRDPPFKPGQTFYNGGTIDTTNLGGKQYEGSEFEFNDELYSGTPPLSARSFRRVVRRVVRNMNAAGNILPKRLVAEVAGTLGGQVAGYSITVAQTRVWPSDEWLPAAGVPPGDLFYVVTRGPATVMTALAADVTNVINQNDQLVALTGTTTQGTGSGRVMTAGLTGATSPLANQILGILAFSMSAMTTSQTNTNLLVDVCIRW